MADRFRQVPLSEEQEELKTAIIDAFEKHQSMGPDLLFAVLGLIEGEIAGLYSAMTGRSKLEFFDTADHNRETGYKDFFEQGLLKGSSTQ